jgi:predicted RNase H-like nuclease (RuvC/YqgF family)
MAIKNITYQRVLNLGNYESKRLELFAEVLEGEDEQEAISRLMEMVERKVREDAAIKFEQEIRQLKKELRELQTEYDMVKNQKENLQQNAKPDPDPDNIPFESGSSLAVDDPNKYF